MTFRLTPALCILFLAGCASSEPQNASYAPAAVQPTTMQSATLPPPSSPVVNPAYAAGSQPAPATSQPVPAFPASVSAAPAETSLSAVPEEPRANSEPIPASEADIAAGVPADATNCSTVDGVTLCDAPFDPNADATHNTN